MAIHLHVNFEDIEGRDGEMGGPRAQHPADGADGVVLRRGNPQPLPPPLPLSLSINSHLSL